MSRTTQRETPASGIPPESLDDFRTLVMGEGTEGRAPQLTRRTQRVLVNMLNTPTETAVSSISSLAETNGVNASTLTRLAQRLGYKGFSELQDVFRQHVSNKRHYYSNHVEQLLCREQSADGGLATLGQVAQEELANVMATLEEVEPSVVAKVVTLLVNARSVRILGLRGCYSVAHYFSYFLSFLRHGVSVLGGPGQTLAEDLCGIGDSDLLVVISFRPYTRDTLTACRAARKRGATLVALTDSLTSPVAATATHVLSVTKAGPFYFNATASTLVLLEGLLAYVQQHLGDAALLEVEQRETLFEELDVEVE